jgi:glycosyltransferase 2 family protein
VTVFLETFWVICAATILAVAAIFAVEGDFSTSTRHVPPWWVLLIVLSATVIAPPIAQRLVRILLNWWMKYRHIETVAVAMPSLRTFSFVCALYVLNFFLLGIVISILAGLLSDHEGVGIFTLTGIFAVAWIAGFITPGAPAGLGIRELILVTSLSPFFGGESAVGIAATLRAVTILGDGLVFIEGGILYRLNIGSRNATT